MDLQPEIVKSMVGSDPHRIVSTAKITQGQFNAEGVPNVAPETAGTLYIRIICLELADLSAN